MKSEYVLIHAASIKHYGIKGQKKGVRRYQLDNGQLTAAGKARYGVGTSNPATDGTHKGGYFTGNTGKTMRKMKDYLLRTTNYRMDDASTAAGLDGRALVGAYGKKVGTTRPSAPSVSTTDSKNPWAKRASAVASTPATKKETKDNLGNNGGRPYSTPYTQETANGRKKNVTGTTSGASANKSSGVNAKKSSDTVYATMAKAIDPIEKRNAVEAENKKKQDLLKTPTKESSNSYDGRKLKEKNAYDESRDAKKKVVKNNKAVALEHLMVDAARSAINAASTTAKPKSNVIKDLDNGAVDTLKKKDLVKIKSGKNTRR